MTCDELCVGCSDLPKAVAEKLVTISTLEGKITELNNEVANLRSKLNDLSGFNECNDHMPSKVSSFEGNVDLCSSRKSYLCDSRKSSSIYSDLSDSLYPDDCIDEWDTFDYRKMYFELKKEHANLKGDYKKLLDNRFELVGSNIQSSVMQLQAHVDLGESRNSSDYLKTVLFDKHEEKTESNKENENPFAQIELLESQNRILRGKANELIALLNKSNEDLDIEKANADVLSKYAKTLSIDNDRLLLNDNNMKQKISRLNDRYEMARSDFEKLLKQKLNDDLSNDKKYKDMQEMINELESKLIECKRVKVEDNRLINELNDQLSRHNNDRINMIESLRASQLNANNSLISSDELVFEEFKATQSEYNALSNLNKIYYYKFFVGFLLMMIVLLIFSPYIQFNSIIYFYNKLVGIDIDKDNSIFLNDFESQIKDNDINLFEFSGSYSLIDPNVFLCIK